MCHSASNMTYKIRTPPHLHTHLSSPQLINVIHPPLLVPNALKLYVCILKTMDLLKCDLNTPFRFKYELTFFKVIIAQYTYADGTGKF